MNFKNTAPLALLSAFLMWLAWPPIPFTTPLLLVGLVPLLIALDKIILKKGEKTGKKVFLTAGLTFLIWNTASIYWVYNAISAVNNPVVSAFVSLIPFGLGALLMTFAFWLYYRLQMVTNKKIAYAGLISFYIAMEYLHQSWDLAFPWMTLGNGLSGMHQLAQWYEYTGVYGGSVWILLSNILAFEAYKRFKSDAKGYLKLRPAMIWTLVVILPIGLSLTKYYQYKEKSIPVNVVTVQPNIDPYQKFGSLSSTDQMSILTHLSDSVAQPNTEYFIWPETAIPSGVNEDRIRTNPDFIAAQNFLEKYKNGTIITGIESIKLYQDKQTLSARKYDNGTYIDVFNGAVQIENTANVQFYHKSKLVPGVEKMPFPAALSILGPIFEGFGGTVGGYGWQDKPGVFYAYSGIGVAPVICYESIWGSWIGEAVKNGAQFIAIITNDGWWGNTSGKDQHLMYAQLRAIETRRYVVRSANTGISCFINQKGDIIKKTKWWTRAALKADINLNDELTLYVKTGDIIPKFLCVIALFLALVIPYRKWTKKA
ncbi:MAG: apolipoprotein N-acyltransferase [Candidatus Pedobacter colombiensis]|uniref:Apolipoprotein N-acyltransferase n=1 Tax=Candidatus Pedobacter colombiensis TaxID=3121371 RepID=A0AAJ6B6H7_9SPHI|nr:apolipoprotein N-acyltransferase [Pedobacter sp.]WEK18934.1 MAG: apolipoprotein N-acyltransferase [Pedobacter sp.]